MRTPKQHPWTHKPLAFFDSLDFPTLYPEKWAKQLGACEGDLAAARKMAAGSLAMLHSPVHGPITQAKHEQIEDFRHGFLALYRWDRRRFLRHLREKLGGKRKATFYWRAMARRAQP